MKRISLLSFLLLLLLSCSTKQVKLKEYHITDNFMVESEKYVPTFNPDSLEDYFYYSEGGDLIFIEDKTNRLHFCTLLGEIMPSSLNESIYRDRINPQIRYFVYEISDNEIDKFNRIFMGYPVDNNFQLEVKKYINSFLYSTPPQLPTPNEEVKGFSRIKYKSGITNENNSGDTVIVEDKFGRDSLVVLSKRPKYKGMFDD